MYLYKDSDACNMIHGPASQPTTFAGLRTFFQNNLEGPHAPLLVQQRKRILWAVRGLCSLRLFIGTWKGRQEFQRPNLTAFSSCRTHPASIPKATSLIPPIYDLWGSHRSRPLPRTISRILCETLHPPPLLRVRHPSSQTHMLSRIFAVMTTGSISQMLVL
jgi:hypothetical protein